MAKGLERAISAVAQEIKDFIRENVAPQLHTYIFPYELGKGTSIIYTPRVVFEVGVEIGKVLQFTEVTVLVTNRLDAQFEYNLELLTCGIAFGRAIHNQPCPDVRLNKEGGYYGPDQDFMTMCQAINNLFTIDTNSSVDNVVKGIISRCSPEAQRVMRFVFEHPDLMPITSLQKILPMIPPESQDILQCKVSLHKLWMQGHSRYKVDVLQEPNDKLFSKFPYDFTCPQMSGMQRNLVGSLSEVNTVFAYRQVAAELSRDPRILTLIEQAESALQLGLPSEDRKNHVSALEVDMMHNLDPKMLDNISQSRFGNIVDVAKALQDYYPTPPAVLAEFRHYLAAASLQEPAKESERPHAGDSAHQDVVLPLLGAAQSSASKAGDSILPQSESPADTE